MHIIKSMEDEVYSYKNEEKATNYYKNCDLEILLPLIISENIWHKKIAMMSTFYFIKKNEFELDLKVAELLIFEKYPMVQKAVVWMLNSIEKFSKEAKKYYKNLRKKDKL